GRLGLPPGYCGDRRSRTIYRAIGIQRGRGAGNAIGFSITMKTLSSLALQSVCGGEIGSFHASPEQNAAFEKCMEKARGKSVRKPGTWTRRSGPPCLGQLCDRAGTGE